MSTDSEKHVDGQSKPRQALVAVQAGNLESARRQFEELAMPGLHEIPVNIGEDVLRELVSHDQVTYPIHRPPQLQVRTLADNPALLIVTPLREDPGNIGETGAPEESGTLNNGQRLAGYISQGCNVLCRPYFQEGLTNMGGTT